MFLHSYRLRNFRRLLDVYIELAPDISIFVGANNSGKTSATHAIQMFLSGSKDRFSLFDFNSQSWKALNELGAADPEKITSTAIPTITLDLWFEVSDSDLYLVLPILPSTDWKGTHVGIRIAFAPRNAGELLSHFKERKREALQRAAALGTDVGNYVPWPKTLTDYLERELGNQFEFQYFVLDQSKFNGEFVEEPGYEPAAYAGEIGGHAFLRSLVKVDFLSAQRYLADPSYSPSWGRAENLSSRLSRFYKRNLEQREDDHTALKALFESEEGLDRHLKAVFAPTLDQIAMLGYPGLHNPRLELKSALNPATVMHQDARVNYILGDGPDAVRLPDSYNGLGFKNLIYMVVELLDVHSKWVADKDERAPLHLIFIEEPEVHMHAQLQQVFIRNVLRLLDIPAEQGGAFRSQIVTTTHSPHILYERGFTPIRYFRRHVEEDKQSTQVLNLSTFEKRSRLDDKEFLRRYLKLTHCDLFFCDAAILVEGNVERLLLPLMIEKEAQALRSASLCILEVGGAYGHRFRELIEFLGITTLIITDIDSVTEVPLPASDNEDQEKEFAVPGNQGQPPSIRYGTKCLPNGDAVTANQTLIQWLPGRRTITELFAAKPTDKIQQLGTSDTAKVCVTYQLPSEITWQKSSELLCGRTLEEAFGLENAAWCQAEDQRSIGLKLKSLPENPSSLAVGLHKRVIGKNFDKTKFALGVLGRSAQHWIVPLYIRQGLAWLKEQVDFEVEREVAAIAAAAPAAPETLDEAGI